MSAKQATNAKLQGSVATYLRYVGVVNNQIKKGLLLSLCENIFKIGDYLAKLQGRTWFSRAFVRLANTLLKDGESARNIDVLACNFAKYSRDSLYGFPRLFTVTSEPICLFYFFSVFTLF